MDPDLDKARIARNRRTYIERRSKDPLWRRLRNLRDKVRATRNRYELVCEAQELRFVRLQWLIRECQRVEASWKLKRSKEVDKMRRKAQAAAAAKARWHKGIR